MPIAVVLLLVSLLPCSALHTSMPPPKGPSADLAYLRSAARQVTSAAIVRPGAAVTGGGVNTTGTTLRAPGGTLTTYPAFWIRDAAMMTGAGFVDAAELNGWIRVIAAIQPGAGGLTFPHGLSVPAYSIPDHITFGGAACWFPGAYTDQGVGNYGYLPPADDAYYFIQIVNEYVRLSRSPEAFRTEVATPWGEQPLDTVCAHAFDSVAIDGGSGLVTCGNTPTTRRVDWGFCDSITKSGECLMPSLLRWQAANRMANLFDGIGKRREAQRFRAAAALIRRSIRSTFYQPTGDGRALLLSATGIGRKDDVWASAFAVWLGTLPAAESRAVARHLVDLYLGGEICEDGQVRQLPRTGPLGGDWESASSGPGAYQNGGYWATPTGWLVVAMHTVDPAAAARLLHEYAGFVAARRAEGAPYEWVNPSTNSFVNANYGSSAGLVVAAIEHAGIYR
ncbi:MAG: hypothetical protein KGJ62_10440 [Armatimonadetes bacterium]|nr:hypothetical protein [Armatimonadota bacterium]